MAETLTSNYGWTKPDPGASANTWGTTLNATTDKVDAQCHANQLAITAGQVPVGGVIMWVGTGLPAGWTWCLNQVLSRTTYAALFAIIGTRFGAGDGSTTFNLPNLGGKAPVGYDGGGWAMGASGGEVTHALAWGEMPTHAHNVAASSHYHTINPGSHNHVVTQWSHQHNIATGGHSHPIHTGGHDHAVQYALIDTNASGLTNGGYSFGLVGGRTDYHGDLGGNTDYYGNLGGNSDNLTSNIVLGASGTGIGNTDWASVAAAVTDTQGSGTAHNNMQPYQVIAFIIRIV